MLVDKWRDEDGGKWCLSIRNKDRELAAARRPGEAYFYMQIVIVNATGMCCGSPGPVFDAHNISFGAGHTSNNNGNNNGSSAQQQSKQAPYMQKPTCLWLKVAKGTGW